ncbi:MAG: ribonuclease HII [Acetilactobacillus jinshanensis]
MVLPKDFNLLQLNDSKRLTPKEREALYPKILDQALDFSIGIGSSDLIDKINIYQADLVAMKRAVSMLNPQPDYLIVDAMHIHVPIPQLMLYHGDAKSVSVGAASIIAKVYRDHLMTKYGYLYPQYDFKHNAGYGTQEHLMALKKYGVTPLHRRTFNPVPKFLK